MILNSAGMAPRALAALLLLFAGPSLAVQDRSGRSVPPEKVEVSLVLLDVVVTDRKGVPVAGLGLADFDLIVDNVRFPIAAVEDRCASPAGEPAETAATGTTVVSDAELRHLIVLFDFSHLMIAPRRDAINATIRFVEEAMGPRDRVMLLGLMRGVHLLHRFSSDRASLRSRLEAVLADRTLIDPAPFEEENTIEALIREMRDNRVRRSPRMRMMSPDPIGSLVARCEGEARPAEMETTSSVRALANMMPAFGGLRGRKSLIFFTETLRANPALPYLAACGADGIRQPSLGLTLYPEMDDLIRRANLAGVSFYPVHAAGLTPLGTSVAQSSARDFQVNMALSTGGAPFVLTKDAIAPFARAAGDLDCHYVLAFAPPAGIRTGKHTVAVSVRRKGVKVRHRESFAIQTPKEASESETLAALASPGLYQQLKIDGHGYSLGTAGGGKRQFLVKASVAAEDLSLPAVPGVAVPLSVRFRGGLVSEGKLECEFSEVVEAAAAGEAGGDRREVGLEVVCELEPGAHELIVAARDERGGALGTLWAKVQVRPPSDHSGSGALVWAPAGPGAWSRRGRTPWLPDRSASLFVRSDYGLRSDEPAALTFIACAADGATLARGDSPEPARVLMEGPASVELTAREAPSGQSGRCRMMRADIPSGTLSAGRYSPMLKTARPWSAVGSRVEVRAE